MRRSTDRACRQRERPVQNPRLGTSLFRARSSGGRGGAASVAVLSEFQGGGMRLEMQAGSKRP